MFRSALTLRMLGTFVFAALGLPQKARCGRALDPEDSVDGGGLVGCSEVPHGHAGVCVRTGVHVPAGVRRRGLLLLFPMQPATALHCVLADGRVRTDGSKLRPCGRRRGAERRGQQSGRAPLPKKGTNFSTASYAKTSMAALA